MIVGRPKVLVRRTSRLGSAQRKFRWFSWARPPSPLSRGFRGTGTGPGSQWSSPRPGLPDPSRPRYLPACLREHPAGPARLRNPGSAARDREPGGFRPPGEHPGSGARLSENPRAKPLGTADGSDAAAGLSPGLTARPPRYRRLSRGIPRSAGSLSGPPRPLAPAPRPRHDGSGLSDGRASMDTPDFDHYPTARRVRATTVLPLGLEALWDDGAVTTHHALWLRENALDPETTHRDTREQALQLVDIPEGLRVLG